MARKLPAAGLPADTRGERVDFHVERGEYNNLELQRLESLLERRGLVPVTIGYSVKGRGGNIYQMHYVAIPTLDRARRPAQFVFV